MCEVLCYKVVQRKDCVREVFSYNSRCKDFFDDEEQLPVYEWGLLRCKNVQQAANILLIEAPTANVARVVPVNINKNVLFIIDMSGWTTWMI